MKSKVSTNVYIEMSEVKGVDDNTPIYIGKKFNGDTVDLRTINEIKNPERREYLIDFTKRLPFLQSLLKRPVDTSILNVFLSVSFTIVPMVMIMLFLELQEGTSWKLHALGLTRFVLGVLQTEGFVLGLHYHAHRPIFISEWAWLTRWAEDVLSPLIGFPSSTYMAHHVYMHHKEDNQIWYDASTTMLYQRDNWFHLLLYILRYIILIPFELPCALLLRGRYLATLQMEVGYWGWFAFVYFAYQQVPIWTAWNMIAPWVLLSILAMRGNNIQHVFVCPDEPENDYRLCYDLVNDPTNKGKFNDSFHVEHHLSPITHWADLPKKFLSYLPKHKVNDSFIFDGLNPDQVHWYIMTGNLDGLADHYVHIGQKSGVNKETLVAEMKRRLKPIRTFKVKKSA